MDTDNAFVLTAIGQVRQESGRHLVEVRDRYRAGLLGLEEFSHVMVLWLFDRAPWDGKTLTTPPCYRRLDHELGIFATRGPLRPSPVAVSSCRLLSLDRERGILAVDWIDADPGSPVIDLKPYHPSADLVMGFTMPAWCSHWPVNRESSGDFDWGAEFTF